MNSDLIEERKKVAFNIEEFTNWYYGGAEKVTEQKFFENYFLNDPELRDNIATSYLSHQELYEESIRKATVVLKKLKHLRNQGYNDKDLYSKILGGTFQKYIFREGNPLSVHFDMFIPAIKNMATLEQQAEWLPKAEICNMIGAYAQTELGHGTFVRGLETTAIFDQRCQQFVINSPTITAYKWWPGGLGHTANYALVFAQLYTQQKNHGVHAFLVQLRDEETHKPLKGITIGEIGTKVGFNSVNNGYLGFKNVRIPLKNMLMKNAKVLPNGQYKKSQSALLNYGTMTYIRVGIVIEAASFMANAATIAMRYSLVRRQSPIEPDQPEPKIIEHVTQQMKIFPVIAKTIIFKQAAEFLWGMFNDVSKELEKGDLSRLPELHALSCCLKAICSNEATQAIEVCRLACGGHGYLTSSGFNNMYKMVTSAQTYEGENTVLLLQTARFLIKSWGQALKGEKLTPTVEYLKHFVSRSGETVAWDGSPNGIIRAFQSATAGKVALAYKHIEERKKFLSPEEAVNQTGIELTKAAELHCQLFLLQSASTSINQAIKKLSPALAFVLRDILELYAVDLAIKSLESLLQFVTATSEDIDRLQVRLEAALKRFRTNAIGIVDGFEISDLVLGSTLGAYDGNVYERLLNEAKKSPLNQEDVNKSFYLYLKPFMKSNL
ncbi:CLUMA_CG016522, isoform F [Clunio marinus]|uniref:Acyl-coenzyme A oxidase n=1 Tax=Clunio marinus TaxID=568069 RepID=A0A1J1ISX2_9DIPT|nr:CLUMA_CG016522, isoform F [Clunio marinus]